MIYMSDEDYNQARDADLIIEDGGLVTNTPLSTMIDAGDFDICTPTGPKVSNGLVLKDSFGNELGRLW